MQPAKQSPETSKHREIAASFSAFSPRKDSVSTAIASAAKQSPEISKYQEIAATFTLFSPRKDSWLGCHYEAGAERLTKYPPKSVNTGRLPRRSLRKDSWLGCHYEAGAERLTKYPPKSVNTGRLPRRSLCSLLAKTAEEDVITISNAI